MCRPTRCRTCGLTTWSGCGAHVEQVKATVAPAQWCNGHEAAPHGAASTEVASKKGWFRRR